MGRSSVEDGRLQVSKIGQKILTALREFGDVVESGDLLEAHFTVRSYVIPAEPAEYDGPAVRAVREQYAMSQGAFARVLCVSSATIQSWEQGRRVPSPIARRFLDEMAASPEHFQARFAQMAAPMAGRTVPAATRQLGDKTGKEGNRAVRKSRDKAI
jgi:DNA-binding transcriptional regulator YiaG